MFLLKKHKKIAKRCKPSLASGDWRFATRPPTSDCEKQATRLIEFFVAILLTPKFCFALFPERNWLAMDMVVNLAKPCIAQPLLAFPPQFYTNRRIRM